MSLKFCTKLHQYLSEHIVEKQTKEERSFMAFFLLHSQVHAHCLSERVREVVLTQIKEKVP
jgi:hypothetical protein